MKASFILILIGILSISCVTQDVDSTIESGLQSVNGTQLFVKTMGTGEPILIVHGGPGLSHDYFLPHLKNLAEDYLLIFYDQRASGQSSMDVDTSSVNFDQFVEDIEGIRKAYGIENLNLLAHSFGGLIAMNYATKYPDKVGNLLLISSIGASTELNDQSNQVLAERFTQEDNMSRMEIFSSNEFRNRNPKSIESLMKIGFKHQFSNPTLVDSLRLNLSGNYFRSSELLQLLGPGITNYDFHSSLSRISAPTLILYGDYDPLAEIAGLPLAETIEGSKLIILEDAGHFPFIEKPEAFKSNVSEFLEN